MPDARTKRRDLRAAFAKTLILDPACGTGTFLYAVVDHIREQFIQQGVAICLMIKLPEEGMSP